MKNRYSLLVKLSLCATILFFFVKSLRERLVDNHCIGKGRIVKYDKNLKTGGNITVDIVFEANNKLYSSSFAFSCADANILILNQKFIDRLIPVVYNRSSPYFLNQPLVKASDYKSFDVIMPDSLKWLDSLVSCKQ